MTRVMTLNVNAYGERHGPWAERRLFITAAIHEARPDVVALQAVARDPSVDGGLNQAMQLARSLTGYEAVYHPATQHDDGREDGLAFLSRRPALATHAFPLSRRNGSEDPFQRVLLHGRFEVPGGELQVFNGHFSWVKAQANDNIAEALPHLRAAKGPLILAGDFNQTPDSEPLARLREAGLSDAWSTLHPDAPGLSFYEHGALSRRIDYVLLDVAAAQRLRAAWLVLDEAGMRRASDHAALLVDLDDPAS
jgi:endonuclease/exonuclease/phosphatase family metal-dependent hydrolase